MSMMAGIDALIDRELWLITSRAGADRGGLIATTVSQASIVPEVPRVLIAIARRHHTWGLIERSRAFAMHLLGEEHLDWVARFGLQSGRDRDKLAGLEWSAGPSGSPILASAVGWVDCRVEAALEIGDRTVYLAEVVASEVPNSKPVLTASGMFKLVPEPIRRELKRQREEAAAADAEAIRAWRSAQTPK